MASDRELKLKLVADVANATKGIQSLDRTMTTFGGRVKAIGADVGARLNGMAIDLAVQAGKAAFDFLQSGVQDAIALQTATDQLARTLENVGAKVPVDKLSDWVGKMELATNISDVELTGALDGLVATYKDVDLAQRMMSLAFDVAAAKGIPLADAIKLVQGAYNGSARAARALGTEGKEGIAALSDAEKTFADANKTRMESVEGSWATVQTAVGEVGQAFGTLLLPAITQAALVLRTQVVPAIMAFSEWVTDELSPAIDAFVADVQPALDGLSELAGSFGLVETAGDALVIGINALMLPFRLAGDGIRNLAIVVGDVFQGDIPQALEDAKVLVQDAVDAVVEVMRAPFTLVVDGLRRLFRGFGVDLDKSISDMMDALSDAVDDAGDWAADIGGAIVDGILDGVANLGRELGNALNDAIDAALSLLPGWAVDFLGLQRGYVQPGYSPPRGRSSYSDAGNRSGSIVVNISSMGDPYSIERAVIKALRRTGVANGRVGISRIHKVGMA